MARVKIGEAARLAGVSKSTLHRAMQTGRVSFETDDKGVRWLDQSEIARVYAGTVETPQRNAPRHAETRAVEPSMNREAELLREMLERERSLNRELAAERDRLLAMLEQSNVRLLEERPPWWRRWRR